jgi:hypothetical protein
MTDYVQKYFRQFYVSIMKKVARTFWFSLRELAGSNMVLHVVETL